MKRSFVVLSLTAAVALAYCSTAKKASRTTPNSTRVTYAANVQPIIAASCTPCHMPPEGKKKPYNNYTAVKGDVDEILTRIQKNPDEKGFMPARHSKLPDSAILVLKQWKTDGLLER